MSSVRRATTLTPQLRNKVWERISILAKEAGGKAALARKVGIARPLLYERGATKKRDPRLAHLCMIHDACDVSLDWLLGYTDKREKVLND